MCRPDAASVMENNGEDTPMIEYDTLRPTVISASAPVGEPSFTSIFQPQTLLQEFSLVNKDIPKVMVEKVCLLYLFIFLLNGFILFLVV